MSAQQDLKLILLCMSHHRYKVRTRRNQVILGLTLHVELKKSTAKRNIWGLRQPLKGRHHYTCTVDAIISGRFQENSPSFYLQHVIATNQTFAGMYHHVPFAVTSASRILDDRVELQIMNKVKVQCRAGSGARQKGESNIWGVIKAALLCKSLFDFCGRALAPWWVCIFFLSCISWPDWLAWNLSQAGDLFVWIWLFISFVRGGKTDHDPCGCVSHRFAPPGEQSVFITQAFHLPLSFCLKLYS